MVATVNGQAACRLWTTQEVADYLAVHRNTVTRLVARGRLRQVKVGKAPVADAARCCVVSFSAYLRGLLMAAGPSGAAESGTLSLCPFRDHPLT